MQALTTQLEASETHASTTIQDLVTRLADVQDKLQAANRFAWRSLLVFLPYLCIVANLTLNRELEAACLARDQAVEQGRQMTFKLEAVEQRELRAEEQLAQAKPEQAGQLSGAEDHRQLEADLAAAQDEVATLKSLLAGAPHESAAVYRQQANNLAVPAPAAEALASAQALAAAEAAAVEARGEADASRDQLTAAARTLRQLETQVADLDASAAVHALVMEQHAQRSSALERRFVQLDERLAKACKNFALFILLDFSNQLQMAGWAAGSSRAGR